MSKYTVKIDGNGDITLGNKVINVAELTKNKNNKLYDIDGELLFDLTTVNSDLSAKALLGGSETQIFKVADGVSPNDAVNKHQLDATAGGSVLTSQDILNKVKTVDGAGSGLDADLFQGQQPTAFATVDGSTTQVFKVADGVTDNDAVNKKQLDTKADGGGSIDDVFKVADGVSANDAVNKEQLDTKAEKGGAITQVFKVADGVGVNDAVSKQQLNDALGTAALSDQDIIDAVKTVDGDGSGLDADLLGGVDNSKFVRNDTDNTIAGNVSITGKLSVTGTIDTINSTTTMVEDKNIEIGKTATPTDVTADGGGITLKGTTDKSIVWKASDNKWHFTPDIVGTISNASDSVTIGGHTPDEFALKQGDDTVTFKADDGVANKEVVNKQQLDTKADKNGSADNLFKISDAVNDNEAVAKKQMETAIKVTTDMVVVNKDDITKLKTTTEKRFVQRITIGGSSDYLYPVFWQFPDASFGVGQLEISRHSDWNGDVSERPLDSTMAFQASLLISMEGTDTPWGKDASYLKVKKYHYAKHRTASHLQFAGYAHKESVDGVNPPDYAEDGRNYEYSGIYLRGGLDYSISSNWEFTPIRLTDESIVTSEYQLHLAGSNTKYVVRPIAMTDIVEPVETITTNELNNKTDIEHNALPSVLLDSIKSVDGKGSGLNAELLDGRLYEELLSIPEKILKISCAGDSVLALTTSNSVYAAGSNTYGQLGLGDIDSTTTFFKVPNIQAKDIACGAKHAMILNLNNTVFTTGDNSKGQLGLGSALVGTTVKTFTTTNFTAKAIACGSEHSLVIKSTDDIVYSTGDNSLGQLGLTSFVDSSVFTTTSEKAKAIACGEEHSAMINFTDDIVYTTGNNVSGQLGLNDLANRKTFTSTSATAKVIACGTKHTMLIGLTDNIVYSTGNNSDGQLGLNDLVNKKVFTSTTMTAISIAGGATHSVLISSVDNKIYCTGLNSSGELGLNNIANVKVFTLVNDIKATNIAVGNTITFIIRSLDSFIYSTGNSSVGALGLKDVTSVEVFTKTVPIVMQAPYIPNKVIGTDDAGMLVLRNHAGADDSFDRLTDTPVNKTGSAGKLVAVNTTETGIEYIDPVVLSATDILNKVKTVDGAGSGLDADTINTFTVDESGIPILKGYKNNGLHDVYIADLDNIVANSVYQTTTATTNVPAATTKYGFVTTYIYSEFDASTAEWRAQLWIGMQSQEMFIRYCNSTGTWSSWVASSASKTLEGMTPTSASTPSTIVSRDSAGNTSLNKVHLDVTSVTDVAVNYYIDTGDGWVSKKTLADVKTELVGDRFVKNDEDDVLDGNYTITGNLVLSGDLITNGTTTTIDSATLAVEDKNIEIGKTTTPTDVTADGGGITLKGATDKTITWEASDDKWHFTPGIVGTISNALALNGHDDTYFAQANGSSLKLFRAKDAVGDNDVINKGQLDISLATKASLSGLTTQLFSVKSGVSATDAINKGQLDAGLNTKAELAGSTTQLFSAKDGVATTDVVNKGQLDTGLGTKAELAGSTTQSFSIKDGVSANDAVSKGQLDTGLATKADKNGNTTEVFKIADAVGVNDAVSKQQLDVVVSSSSITDLSDTPTSLTNNGGKLLSVKSDTTGVEFVEGPSLQFGDSPLINTEYMASKGVDLIANGTGLLGNTYNMPSNFVFDPKITPNVPGSFRFDGHFPGIVLIKEFLPINPSEVYGLRSAIRQTGYRHIHYMGVAMYDIDKNSISSYQHMRFHSGGVDSYTTLTVPLAVGDTTITVANAEGWQNEAASYSDRSIIIFEYANSKGHVYDYYSRIHWNNGNSGAWSPGGINKATGVITLDAPFPASNQNPNATDGTWPIGTRIANASAGGTYKYSCYSSFKVPELDKWYKVSNFIGGIDKTGTNLDRSFSPGTAFAKILWLPNYSNKAGGGFGTYPDSGNTAPVWYASISVMPETMGKVVPGTANKNIIYIPQINSTNDGIEIVTSGQKTAEL